MYNHQLEKKEQLLAKLRALTPDAAAAQASEKGSADEPVLDMSQWTVDDVASWLMSENLSKVVPYFRKKNIDGPQLLTLSFSDLQALGLSVRVMVA